MMSLELSERLLKVPRLTDASDKQTRLTSELLFLANVVWHESGMILPTNILSNCREQVVEHATRTGVKLAVQQTILERSKTEKRFGVSQDLATKIGFIENNDEMNMTLKESLLPEYKYTGDPFVELIMDYFREHVDAQAKLHQDTMQVL